MSDTRHLSDLKFDERPLSMDLQSVQSEAPQTDMVMLQKADVWMSQFKTRLNISIIGLVVLWGGVSYYKSTGIMQLAAHSAPETERFLADGSMDESSQIQTLEVDSMQRGMPLDKVEAVETEDTEIEAAVEATDAPEASPSTALVPAPVVAPAAAVAPIPAPAKVAKPVKPASVVKKTAAKKSQSQKASSGTNTNRNQKKLKKSVASKSAS